METVTYVTNHSRTGKIGTIAIPMRVKMFMRIVVLNVRNKMKGIRTKPEPYCPECGAKMKLRKPGINQHWQAFWGCSQYPDCHGTRNIGEDGKPESNDF
jgi:hypothetical protein